MTRNMITLRKEVDTLENGVYLRPEDINACVVIDYEIAVVLKKIIALLGVYTFVSRILGDPVACNDTAKSYISLRDNADNIITVTVKARLKKLGRINYANGVTRRFTLAEPMVYGVDDVFVSYSVERGMLYAPKLHVRFSENKLGKTFSVKTSVGEKYSLSEVFHKLTKAGRGGKAYFSGNLVSVKTADTV